MKQKESPPSAAASQKEPGFRRLPSSVSFRRSGGVERESESERSQIIPSAIGSGPMDPEPIAPAACPQLCCLHREVGLDDRALALHLYLHLHPHPRPRPRPHLHPKQGYLQR